MLMQRIKECRYLSCFSKVTLKVIVITRTSQASPGFEMHLLISTEHKGEANGNEFGHNLLGKIKIRPHDGTEGKVRVLLKSVEFSLEGK